MSHIAESQEYEAVTPAGHKIIGSFNQTTNAFECFVYHRETGDKISLSEEVTGGIAAAMRADAVVASAEDNSDEWQQTIRDLKTKQAQYLRELSGAAADILVDRLH